MVVVGSIHAHAAVFSHRCEHDAAEAGILDPAAKLNMVVPVALLGVVGCSRSNDRNPCRGLPGRNGYRHAVGGVVQIVFNHGKIGRQYRRKCFPRGKTVQPRRKIHAQRKLIFGIGHIVSRIWIVGGGVDFAVGRIEFQNAEMRVVVGNALVVNAHYENIVAERVGHVGMRPVTCIIEIVPIHDQENLVVLLHELVPLALSSIGWSSHLAGIGIAAQHAGMM